MRGFSRNQEQGIGIAICTDLVDFQFGLGGGVKSNQFNLQMDINYINF